MPKKELDSALALLPSLSAAELAILAKRANMLCTQSFTEHGDADRVFQVVRDLLGPDWPPVYVLRKSKHWSVLQDAANSLREFIDERFGALKPNERKTVIHALERGPRLE